MQGFLSLISLLSNIYKKTEKISLAQSVTKVYSLKGDVVYIFGPCETLPRYWQPEKVNKLCIRSQPDAVFHDLSHVTGF
jgi:hypothetical protein